MVIGGPREISPGLHSALELSFTNPQEVKKLQRAAGHQVLNGNTTSSDRVQDGAYRVMKREARKRGSVDPARIKDYLKTAVGSSRIDELRRERVRRRKIGEKSIEQLNEANGTHDWAGVGNRTDEPETAALQHELEETILRVARAVTKGNRINEYVFYELVYKGRPCADVARELGISESGAKNRAYRIRREMAKDKELKEAYDES